MVLCLSRFVLHYVCDCRGKHQSCPCGWITIAASQLRACIRRVPILYHQVDLRRLAGHGHARRYKHQSNRADRDIMQWCAIERVEITVTHMASSGT
jgi:hypothetical protein